MDEFVVEFFSVFDVAELNRKKLRLIVSPVVDGERGDLGVDRGVD